MSNPIPKTKQQEIYEILEKVGPHELLSEFAYGRCLRLLKSIETLTVQDEYQMLRAFVEHYYNNLAAANAYAEEMCNISTNLRVLRNADYIFRQNMNYPASVSVYNKIAHIGERLNMNIQDVIPSDIELPISLSGKSSLIGFNIDLLGNNLSAKVSHLQDIIEELDVSSEDLLKLINAIHSTVLELKARCISVEYSYIEDDFLVLIYVNKTFEDIYALNDMVFEKCYENKLTEVLKKVSYYFVPFSEDENE